MIHELIVTSVPRGLQTGRSGFTTVLRTRGIHPRLAESLERSSGYRHVFPQGDPRNPTIRSHRVVAGATGAVSVLSRIVDAGSDYSGRSNKLAHHFALDAGETTGRATSNPAAVLLALEQSGGFPPRWSGEPREQPVACRVPTVPSEPGLCRAWASAAGDAGWAGLLVDRALARQPTWIIAPPGLDLVELFDEALGLVHYPQRWGVTFTNYALAATDALWLGTVEGSPEAQSARGQTRLQVVDLVRRPVLTATSPLIQAARGMHAVPWKHVPARGPASSPPPLSPIGPSATAVPPGGEESLPSMMPGVPPELHVGQPPQMRTASPESSATAALQPELLAQPVPRWRSIALQLLGLVVTVSIVAGVGYMAWRGQRSAQPANKKPAKEKPTPPSSPAPMDQGQSVDTLVDPAQKLVEAQDRAKDFDLLRSQLGERDHLPLADPWSLDEPESISQPICLIGTARIEASLPELRPFEPRAGEGQWKLACTGPADGPWAIRVEPVAGDPSAKAIEIARLDIAGEGDQRQLSLTLLEMPAAGDRFWVASREALTTAPLVLRMAGEPPPDTEHTTHVQLCPPVWLEPLRFERLLTDVKWLPKEKGPGRSVEGSGLPITPWPWEAEFTALLSDGITLAPPEPEPVVPDGRREACEWRGRWIWGGDKPFMETTLAFENLAVDPAVGGRTLTARVTDSRVLPPWDDWEHLGLPKDLLAPKPLPPLSDALRKQLERLTPQNDELPPGVLAQYGPMAKRYRQAWRPTDLQSLLLNASTDAEKGAPAGRPSWKDVIRLALGRTPSYIKWATEKAGIPPPPPDPATVTNPQTLRQQRQEYHSKRNEWKKSIQEMFFPASGVAENKAKEFWRDLQNDLKREDQNYKYLADDASVALCCMYFELEPVLEKKKQAVALLEAVGEGSVELHGQIWVAPCSGSGPRVLLAEFQPGGSDSTPTSRGPDDP